jgi:predicted O-methyltransferase YrrM
MSQNNTPKVITLDVNVLNSIDMSATEEFTKWNSTHTEYFSMPAGQEHYRMLAFLAKEVGTQKPIIDIGTYFGFSALALSSENKSKVVTYDIVDCIPDDGYTMKSKDNIQFRIMDCLNDLETLANADLISLDIAHEADIEQEIMTALKKHNYQGLLFLDDIKLNKEMADWWSSIDLLKYDLTKYGHWSGSGLVVFDPSRFSIVLN